MCARYSARLRATAGHRRQEDHGRALAYLGFEAVERADVLAVHVGVHEPCEAPVGVDPLRELGVAAREVVEHLGHGLAGDADLALASRFGAEGGRDADGDAHAAAQNST